MTAGDSGGYGKGAGVGNHFYPSQFDARQQWRRLRSTCTSALTDGGNIIAVTAAEGPSVSMVGADNNAAIAVETEYVSMVSRSSSAANVVAVPSVSMGSERMFASFVGARACANTATSIVVRFVVAHRYASMVYGSPDVELVHQPRSASMAC